jgi:hypothetical protein
MDQTSKTKPNMPPAENTNVFAAMFALPFSLFPNNGQASDKAPFPAPDFGAASQVGAELLGLAKLRTQAMMDLPTKASQCKAPQDLATVMTEYWQTAWTQQMDTGKKITELFTSAAGQNNNAARDFMTLPDAGKDKPNTPFSGRRAA